MRLRRGTGRLSFVIVNIIFTGIYSFRFLRHIRVDELVFLKHVGPHPPTGFPPKRENLADVAVMQVGAACIYGRGLQSSSSNTH